jgi:UDP-N-acetyl-D-galactosamine dehydrogenase
LKKGDIVFIHGISGVTEDECVPVGKSIWTAFNVDFFVGYSPERINPKIRNIQ